MEKKKNFVERHPTLTAFGLAGALSLGAWAGNFFERAASFLSPREQPLEERVEESQEQKVSPFEGKYIYHARYADGSQVIALYPLDPLDIKPLSITYEVIKDLNGDFIADTYQRISFQKERLIFEPEQEVPRDLSCLFRSIEHLSFLSSHYIVGSVIFMQSDQPNSFYQFETSFDCLLPIANIPDITERFYRKWELIDHYISLVTTNLQITPSRSDPYSTITIFSDNGNFSYTDEDHDGLVDLISFVNGVDISRSFARDLARGGKYDFGYTAYFSQARAQQPPLNQQ